MTRSDDELRAAILTIARARGPTASFCPSEPARALAGDWRALMPALRKQAAQLQRAGVIEVLQRGAPVDASTARGPIRLRLKE